MTALNAIRLLAQTNSDLNQGDQASSDNVTASPSARRQITARATPDNETPAALWLVWLHGFLGSGAEWLPLARRLPAVNHLLIDLPGHGGSARIATSDFSSVNACLHATLRQQHICRYWLIGYSLGGRIALYHACQGDAPGLCGLIAEGAHPGLSHAHERRARQQSDQHWAQRLRTEPLAQLLDDWYRQPVFATLNAQQRAGLIALRCHNQPQALAAMLSATSLGQQPDLRPALARLAVPFHTICGEQDSKFRALAQSLRAPCHLIPSAGHNAHRENPAQMAEQIAAILRQHHKEPL